MLKWQAQRKGETQEQYEARVQAFGASARARAALTKARLNARHAKGPNKFLSDTSGTQVPARRQPAMPQPAPSAKSCSAPKDRNSSHLRGLPPDSVLREVRRRHSPPLRVADSEEIATIHALVTTIYQIAAAQKIQDRDRGGMLDCRTLKKLLGFLYKQKIPLRSGVQSEAVCEYARKLAIDEPQLKNTRATARSRLRRLTDLRRKQGFPDPRPGRKSSQPK
jgi:hypothetical protein